MMQVHIQNDGPVTIEIESPQNVKTTNSRSASSEGGSTVSWIN